MFQQALSGLEALFSGGVQTIPMASCSTFEILLEQLNKLSLVDQSGNAGNRNPMEPPINVHVSVSPITASVGGTATSSHASASNQSSKNSFYFTTWNSTR